ncbi:MAG: ABC transporter permease [Oscillospiraceae bacterium]|nr:ABC transporter permease [Oscillospiraceae bacterium]
MNAVKAIFTKQLNDLTKNVSVTIMFVLFPVMALMLGSLMGGEEGAMQVGMFAAMFVGSTPMIVIANNVAEDIEYKGLRFLVMAGVRPWQYLLGLTGFVLVMSAASVAAFVFIGSFSGELLIRFIAVAVLGLIASSILGGAIGIFAKNVQQASVIYTPFMMLLAFLPMASMFNEFIAQIAPYLFSYQVLRVIMDPYADFTHALIVIGVNIVLLLAFFIVAYKKKGLRG